MPINNKNNYLLSEVTKLKGVGVRLSKYLKNKKLERINDLLWNLPYSYTDRSKNSPLNKLEIGKISTIKVLVKKYNFPRIRNLPNKVNCEDETGKIDIIFFNSREGYIRKVLPLNKKVVISGKINFYKKKYQITNPEYIAPIDNMEYVQKVIPKYSLTQGINEKLYRKIIEQIIKNLPEVEEWHDPKFLKENKFPLWRESITTIHNPNEAKNFNSNAYRRLAYDEIFSHLLVLSKNRKKIKRIKKNPKKFTGNASSKLINSLDFKLTKSQEKVINEINFELKSNNRMFRILQGDVGSGKTIVSLICVLNVIESGFQCALMAPTSILANQHFNLAKKLFKNTAVNVEILTGKTEYKKRKEIMNNLNKNKIHFLVGTHSLFQNKILFKKLGLIIIDEQHKFGVKQRMDLAKKGGDTCDILLMSATPIPRTMMLAFYGDMDISKITEKPLNRKPILTLSKPEEKIDELWPLIKNNINKGNQIFWVCPLIKESKFFNYTSAVKKFEIIKKMFPNKVGLVHGSLDKEEKEKVLNQFLNKEIDILISTTVIEVGIDFPNANLIIIENSNKFGLAQLHQLRGRVGRGAKEGMCILLFKGNLNDKAIKRIRVLKSTDDGFILAEEDMRLRGYGDIIGYQQSGAKFFKLADPVHHEDLFKIAEKNIKFEENKLVINKKYDLLLKLFDKAEIINQDTSS